MNSGGANEVSDELRRLIDRVAIGELIANYSYFIDHGRHTDVVDLFTDDCVVEYGIAPTVTGRSELAAVLAAAADASDPETSIVATSHHNADVRIDLAPGADRATGTVSLYAWHQRGDGSRAEVWGYYEDVYQRVGELWRFARRELRVCGEDGFPAAWTPIARSVDG